MANNQVLLEGVFINDNPKEWIEADIVFDAEKMAKILIDYKDVFAGNKGRGRISICRSKNGQKRYASLSTWIPTAQETITPAAHMPDRNNDDLPF